MRDWVIAFSIAFLLLVVYTFTLCPTIYWEDSGEFITAAYYLDIPHPPGFPLWCLLAKPFTWLPWGNIAWRVNFSSAFFAASGIALFYMLLRNWGVTRSSAASGAGVLGCTFSFWRESLVAEVYTLAFTLFIASVCLFWRWGLKPKGRRLFAAWWVYGCGITTHYFLLCVLPAFLFFTFIRGSGVRGLGVRLGWAGMGVLSGLSFFLYLPIRSLANPPMDWGNPETLSLFLAHIGRVMYAAGESQLAGGLTVPIKVFQGWGDFWVRIVQGVWEPVRHIVWSELRGFAAVIGVIGVMRVWRLNRRLFWMTLALFVSAGMIIPIATQGGFGFTQDRVLLRPVVPALIMMIVWVAFGMDGIWVWLGTRPWRSRWVRVAVLLFPLFFFFRNVEACSLRGYRAAEDFGRTLLERLPQDAILFTVNDSVMFVTTYLTEVEKLRPDVKLIPNRFRQGVYPEQVASRFPDIHFPSQEELDRMRAAHTKVHPAGFYDEGFSRTLSHWLLKHNSARTRIFWDVGQEQPGPGFSLLPRGLVAEVVPEARLESKFQDAGLEHQGLWAVYEEKLFKSEKILHDTASARIFATLRNNFGHVFALAGDGKGALQEYEWAVRLDPSIAEPYYNIGTLYLGAGHYPEALRYIQKALERKPLAAPIHLNLGTVYRNMGQYPEAIQSYQRAIELDPDLKESYNNLGALFAHLKRYDDAISLYHQSLEMGQDTGLVHYNLGLSLHRKGQVVEAVRHYETAIGLGFQSIDLYYGLGVALASQGDFKRAIQAWENTLKLDPGHRLAKENIEGAHRFIKIPTEDIF